MRGLSTTKLRYAWGDGVHCYSGPLAVLTLHGGARISVRPGVLVAFKAINDIFVKHDYRATPPDCGAMNCRPITGGTKISLHGLAIAADINWQANPWQLNDGTIVHDIPDAVIADIEALYTNSGAPLIRCGIHYEGAHVDPMHFEVCCTPADVASGIAGLAPVVVPIPRPTAAWVPFRPGDTAASIMARHGLDNEILEVQLMLTALGINVGRLDNDFGDKTQAGVSEAKRRVIAEQKKNHQVPWPNTDPIVGPDFIQTLRWLNHAHALAA